MSGTFRDFTTDDAVLVAADSLSRAAGEPVVIEDVSPLGDEQRRNHIIRAVARRASGDRQHIVIKATRAADYNATSEDIDGCYLIRKRRAFRNGHLEVARYSTRVTNIRKLERPLCRLHGDVLNGCLVL